MILSSIFILIIFNIYASKADDCEYSTPDGILDLKTFGYKNRPKYTDIPDTNPQALLTYSFNGCFDFSTKDSCRNAAICAIEQTTKTNRLLARQAGRKFTYSNGLSTIIYTDGSGTTVNVFLVCATVESNQASRIDDNSFILHMESKCACPGKCTYKSSDGLTGGAIFIIVLICIVGTYLIISVLFLRFARHEKGIDLIPNRTLWLQIGIDSIHGVRFILSKVTGRNAYEAV